MAQSRLSSLRSYYHCDESLRVISVIAAASLPGDHNDDGAVDAADYVMWRKIDRFLMTRLWAVRENLMGIYQLIWRRDVPTACEVALKAADVNTAHSTVPVSPPLHRSRCTLD